ncbi:MAG TPA: hypothetical protein VIG05_04960, partial [Candidatus Nitrosotenuis sp.]
LNNYRFEKSSYKPISVEVSGMVDDSKTGTYVILTIIKPDQTAFDLKGVITKRGEFTVPFMLDASSLSGQYAVMAKYNNVEVGAAFFIIE